MCIRDSYNGSANEQYNMQFFFGPNSYKVLKEYGDHLDLPDVINLSLIHIYLADIPL